MLLIRHKRYFMRNTVIFLSFLQESEGSLYFARLLTISSSSRSDSCTRIPVLNSVPSG